MTSQPLFQNTFNLRRPRVAIFAGIIKILTMFVKTIFKDSKKVKRIRNWVSKCKLSVYVDIGKFADCQRKNAHVSRT